MLIRGMNRQQDKVSLICIICILEQLDLPNCIGTLIGRVDYVKLSKLGVLRTTVVKAWQGHRF